MTFGQWVAEDEVDQLASYFVETDHWNRLFLDLVDIIYGPKGSGKSALYSLLVDRRDALFIRHTILAPAENPRGTPAFRTLVTDPPATEREFIDLWKLYLACIISNAFDEFGIQSPDTKLVETILANSGLKTKEWNLQSVLKFVFDYVKRFRPSAIEGGIAIDPGTQSPSGITGKISFDEPSSKQAEEGISSVDSLLKLEDKALQQYGYKIWILLDRLDVAFSDSPRLEQNALSALFHVYLDLLALKNLKIKIFLRTDIWRRITTSGFREASHITRALTISWDEASLINLIVRRALQNDGLIKHYNIDRANVLSSTKSQEGFLYKIFPDQIDVGSRKPKTLQWIFGRIRDGTKQCAPRELVHLLNVLRNTQVRRIEVGDQEPEGGKLFARSVFKEALQEVSRNRLEQTVYAEYPALKDSIEKLRNQKTQHNPESLSRIWKISREDTKQRAQELVEIGFFERKGDLENPVYWVPLLYRNALNLIQGSAE